MARADRSQLVISQARADEARAQLALVDEQLGRTRIEAPFDGVVIRGDLSQSLGSPVQRGDVLLTVVLAVLLALGAEPTDPVQEEGEL